MILATFWTFVLFSRTMYSVLGTIDVNLSELEFLAARLDPFECRRLVAALHYASYELPMNLAAAERKVDEEIPCVRQLLHWNVSPDEGRGKSHEALAHRLRQLDRNDLADWLGRTAFEQLGKDLERVMERPFGELGTEDNDTGLSVTIEQLARTEEEEDSWMGIDTSVVALLLGLIGALIAIIGAIIVHRIRLFLYQRKRRYPESNRFLENTTSRYNS